MERVLHSYRGGLFVVFLGVVSLLGGSPIVEAQSHPLPPGHPPVGQPSGSPSIPGPPGESEIAGQGLIWTMPRGWTQEVPSSPLRRAQYRIPGPGGPGECVIFYFGPGQGGDAKANAARWASQFHRPDGTPIGDGFKTREIKVGDIPVVLVEVTGTYVGGMGAATLGPEQPDYMLLGAIARGPDANWFFRATGRRATLEAQRAAFDALIHSVRRATPGHPAN